MPGVNEMNLGEAFGRRDSVSEPDVFQYEGMQEMTLKLATLIDDAAEYTPTWRPIRP